MADSVLLFGDGVVLENIFTGVLVTIPFTHPTREILMQTQRFIWYCHSVPDYFLRYSPARTPCRALAHPIQLPDKSLLGFSERSSSTAMIPP